MANTYLYDKKKAGGKNTQLDLDRLVQFCSAWPRIENGVNYAEILIFCQKNTLQVSIFVNPDNLQMLTFIFYQKKTKFHDNFENRCNIC